MAALNEETAVRAAPDSQVLNDARGLIRKGRYSNPGASADGTWLLGNCQGSAKAPYQVSVDILVPDAPVGRCNCGSRKFPCKHAVGLMLLHAQEPARFDVREPDADLLAKREKAQARAEKKADEKPKKVNTAALAKKAQVQREGLDLLEKLLVDLVSSGQWFEQSRLERLGRQRKQLMDAYLRGAAYGVNQLVLFANDPVATVHSSRWRQNDETRGAAISEEERLAVGADLIGQLWATVQKGRNYLDGKIAGDESAADADAVMENVLGRAWKLNELRDAGHCRQNLSLMELAHERYDDQAGEMKIEISHLVELAGGEILQATTLRPFAAMQHIDEQPSYSRPFKIAEAGVYPGFINRRVRWETAAEQSEELKPDHLKAAYAAARPEFKPAIDEFRKQLKHPLAPRDAVLWLRCERIGHVGDRLVMEDASGVRVVTGDLVDRTGNNSNVMNLECAAGMLGGGHPAALARLFVDPAHNAILAQPLALLTPDRHLRLGM
jgi:SWIM zinc finger